MFIIENLETIGEKKIAKTFCLPVPPLRVELITVNNLMTSLGMFPHLETSHPLGVCSWDNTRGNPTASWWYKQTNSNYRKIRNLQNTEDTDVLSVRKPLPSPRSAD